MLAAELKQIDAALEQLTSESAPHLRGQFGVGPQTAAALIAVAGDNPERLHSEAALAALCGASPLQASSGKTIRHRLNRGGDRSANNALWTIAMVRMRSEPRTRAYGKTRRLCRSGFSFEASNDLALAVFRSVDAKTNRIIHDRRYQMCCRRPLMYSIGGMCWTVLASNIALFCALKKIYRLQNTCYFKG